MAGSLVWQCRRHGRAANRICNCPHAKYGIIFYVGGRAKERAISPIKREAELALEEVNHQIRAGTYNLLQPIRFKDLAKLYLDLRAKTSLKSSTFKSYSYKLHDHLIPRFGEMWVADITRKLVEGYRAELIQKGKHAQVSVADIMNVLRIVLNVAVEWNHLQKNPAVRLRPMPKALKEVPVLEPHEVNLLLRNVGEPWRTMWYTAVMTGMREGELVALKKSDIDWDNDTITIQRSLGRGKVNGEYEWITPKSAAGVRTIEMWAELKKALQTYLITAPENQYGLVFASQNGLPINANNMTKRVWAEALKQAKIQHIKFHALRHTHASVLIAAGADIKYIQHRLGHSSSRVTLDTYGHLMKGSGKQVSTKIEGMFRLEPTSETTEICTKPVPRLVRVQASKQPNEAQNKVGDVDGEN